MTTSATPLRAESAGNGSGLNHPYDWKIDAKEELLVTKITDATGAEETLTVDTDYTVTGVGNAAGGNVVIDPALASGYSLVITPNMDYSQTADFTNQNSVPPDEVESALDRLSIQIKSLVEQMARAVKTTVGSSVSPDDLITDITNKAASATASATAAEGHADDAETWGLYAAAQAALLPQNNYTATTDPTVNDDSDDGYIVGSTWFNTSSGDRFQCTNATVGAAVWVDISALDPADVGTMAYETATDYYAKSEVAEIRQIPQNSKSADYTAVLADAGKHIFHPTADTTPRTFTIPANASVAYPIGTAITFVNQNGAGDITIAITTDTMRLAPDGTTGSRTLTANGVATALKITSTEWIISGTGLS